MGVALGLESARGPVSEVAHRVTALRLLVRSDGDALDRLAWDAGLDAAEHGTPASIAGISSGHRTGKACDE